MLGRPNASKHVPGHQSSIFNLRDNLKTTKTDVIGCNGKYYRKDISTKILFHN